MQRLLMLMLMLLLLLLIFSQFSASSAALLVLRAAFSSSWFSRWLSISIWASFVWRAFCKSLQKHLTNELPKTPKAYLQFEVLDIELNLADTVLKEHHQSHRLLAGANVAHQRSVVGLLHISTVYWKDHIARAHSTAESRATISNLVHVGNQLHFTLSTVFDAIGLMGKKLKVKAILDLLKSGLSCALSQSMCFNGTWYDSPGTFISRTILLSHFIKIFNYKN